MTPDHAKIALLRSFDPAADDDEVPDPYYGPDSGFARVLAMTEAAVPGIVEEIRRLLHERRTSDRDNASAAGSGR
jgi:protein-tyrosine phosphatase